MEITDLVDNTFYALLRLVRDDVEISVSARPSDAVALALRVGAPMLVRDDLMSDETRLVLLDEDDDAEPAEDEDELLAELRDFLDTVKPEDFDQ